MVLHSSVFLSNTTALPTSFPHHSSRCDIPGAIRNIMTNMADHNVSQLSETFVMLSCGWCVRAARLTQDSISSREPAGNIICAVLDAKSTSIPNP